MNIKNTPKELTLNDMFEGSEHKLENFEITADMINAFTELSTDYSPIHIQDNFARQRGFRGRVVHGVFFATILSKIVGMDFPGQNALLQSINLTFLSPAYIGDKITIISKVAQVSNSTSTIIIKSKIINELTKQLICRAKIQVGFTKEKGNKNE